MKYFVFPEQSLAKLQERFHLDQSIGRSEPDLRSSPVNSHLSLSRQTLDAGSQTSISGDVSYPRGRVGPGTVLTGPDYNTDGKWNRGQEGGANSSCVHSAFHTHKIGFKNLNLIFSAKVPKHIRICPYE